MKRRCGACGAANPLAASRARRARVRAVQRDERRTRRQRLESERASFLTSALEDIEDLDHVGRSPVRFKIAESQALVPDIFVSTLPADLARRVAAFLDERAGLALRATATRCIDLGEADALWRRGQDIPTPGSSSPRPLVVVTPPRRSAKKTRGDLLTRDESSASYYRVVKRDQPPVAAPTTSGVVVPPRATTTLVGGAYFERRFRARSRRRAAVWGCVASGWRWLEAFATTDLLDLARHRGLAAPAAASCSSSPSEEDARAPRPGGDGGAAGGDDCARVGIHGRPATETSTTTTTRGGPTSSPSSSSAHEVCLFSSEDYADEYRRAATQTCFDDASEAQRRSFRKAVGACARRVSPETLLDSVDDLARDVVERLSRDPAYDDADDPRGAFARRFALVEAWACGLERALDDVDALVAERSMDGGPHEATRARVLRAFRAAGMYAPRSGVSPLRRLAALADDEARDDNDVGPRRRGVRDLFDEPLWAVRRLATRLRRTPPEASPGPSGFRTALLELDHLGWGTSEAACPTCTTGGRRGGWLAVVE